FLLLLLRCGQPSVFNLILFLARLVFNFIYFCFYYLYSFFFFFFFFLFFFLNFNFYLRSLKALSLSTCLFICIDICSTYRFLLAYLAGNMISSCCQQVGLWFSCDCLYSQNHS